jgi:cyclic pyranopterin phosphate synthase
MLDRFNREISYLRISVTDRCNLRCHYCAPAHLKFLPKEKILSFEQIEAVVRAATRIGFRKVRLTGGEPLVRKDIEMLVGRLAHIPEIEVVALTTNGMLLAEKAALLKQNGASHINISLDTLDSDAFRKTTVNGDLAQVLNGIDAAIAQKFAKIKINMIVFPKTTAVEISQMEHFCAERGMELQRIKHFRLADHNSYEQNHRFERPSPCHQCNRIRLLSTGQLKPCLFSNEEVDVDFDNIEASIKKAIWIKPETGSSCSNRSMMAIGG